MKKRFRFELSYANVAATVALLLALGGGTTAIALRGNNTVGTKDIRPGNVTGRDLSQIRVVRKVFTLAPPSMSGISSDFFILKCPRGTRVVGGGGNISASAPGRGWMTRTDVNGNGWQITASLADTTEPASVAVTALCLKRKPGRPITDD